MTPFHRPGLSYLILAISGAGHAIAVILTISSASWVDAAVGRPVLVLVLISFVLAVAMFLLDNRLVFRLLVAVRLFCILLIGNAFPGHHPVEALLLWALIVEVGVGEPYPVGLATSLAISALSIALAVREYVLSPSSAGARLADELLFAASYPLLSFTTGLFHRYREMLVEEQTRVANLGEAVSRLSEANIGFQEYAHTAEERSVLQERLRYSREVHDTIGATLTNLMVMMEDVSDLIFDDPREAAEIAQKAREHAERGLEETRRSLYALRGAEIRRASGIQAIQKLVSVFRQAIGVSVVTEYGNIRWKYSEEIDQAVYHVVQEGLTNAFHHGRATVVRLYFWESDNVLRIRIHDNGKGASELKEGIGFQGMRERLRPLGGSMGAGNVTDGFELTILIPTSPPEKP